MLVVSDAFQPPAVNTVVVCSANVEAAGAVVSKVNEANEPAEPTLPATSVTFADNTFAPSLPKSVLSTVKST